MLIKNQRNNNNILFENKTLWENYDQDNVIMEKSRYLAQLIPDDVDSILDVGCGNGIITNYLSNNYRVTGADLSWEALRHVKSNKFQTSADALAIKDQSLDMVFSSELLEHLPKDNLSKAIAEFCRISRKYLLITVPNNELLAASFLKCPACMNIFHIYGHINSLTADHLEDLVGDDFETTFIDYTGPKIRSYNPFLLKIKRMSGKHWFPATEHSICPKCGNTNFPENKSSILSKICNGLNIIFAKNKYYWLVILLRRVR